MLRSPKCDEKGSPAQLVNFTRAPWSILMLQPWRKYIVLNDTTTFAERGETEGRRGLWPAVEEFLARGTFRLKERFVNNNGLTVLEAVGAAAA